LLIENKDRHEAKIGKKKREKITEFFKRRVENKWKDFSPPTPLPSKNDTKETY
jgi:hypothetical protein